MPAALSALSTSPNKTNAASNDSNKDKRCAASLRTMPAWRTDAAKARKMVGNNTPSPINASQGAPGARNVSSVEGNSHAVSTLATR